MAIEFEDAFDEIKRIYLDNLHFSEDLVDYLSHEEILTTSLSGRSNTFISNKFGLAQEEVEKIITEYLGFSGWKYDFDFDPYEVYTTSKKEFDAFVFNCYLISSNYPQELIVVTYFICRIFDELRERMDNEYYRT